MPIATTGSASYVDTAPTATSQRCYRVSAANSCGESTQSPQAACGLAGAAPIAPGVPTATAGCGEIALTWPVVSGATSYKIFRDGIALAIVGGSPWTDTNPLVGASRCYRVSALNDCGESPQSGQASCAAAGSVPGVPAVPVATSGCGTITLTWAPVTGAMNYRVYRDGVPVATTGGSSWVDANPTTSTPRCYRVSALSSCGESSQSVQASCATALALPSAPATPIATAGCSQITLAWPPVSGAASYKIYRDGVPIATVGSSPFTDTNPTSVAQRCYRVSALAACGEGAQSGEASCALAQRPPGAPADARVEPACSSFRLTWSGAQGALGYKVYRDGIGLATITGVPLAFDDGSPGAPQRCYRVTAFNGCGEGDPTEAVCASLRKPPHPTQVNPPGGEPGTVVTIGGLDFGAAVSGTGVEFTGNGGQSIPAVVSAWSDSEIHCIVPVGAITGGVTVINPCGSTTALAWTPIRIAALVAAEREGAVELVWRLLDDARGARFHIYRRLGEGEFTRITSQSEPMKQQNLFLDQSIQMPGRYTYSIRQLDRNGREDVLSEIGLDFEGFRFGSRVGAVSPNPARQLVNVEYLVASDEPITLAVFDVQGRRLSVLAEGRIGRGRHYATWNCRQSSGEPCSPGLYFIRLVTSDVRSSKKLVIAR